MNQRTYIFLLPIFLLTVWITVAFTTCVAQVEVNPFSSETLAFNMTYGKIFQCSMSIKGDYENSIDFWVTNPKGDVILKLGRVSNNPTRFEFGSFQDGVYTLHFDNSYSSQSTKKVTLMYEIFQDIVLPAYLVGLIVWLIGPPSIKHFLNYGCVKNFAISLAAVTITITILGLALYKPII